jgi:hypothetical protein
LSWKLSELENASVEGREGGNSKLKTKNSKLGGVAFGSPQI